MKKMLSIGMVFALTAGVIAGCGSNDTKSDSKAAEGEKASAKPVTLTMWVGTAYKDVEGVDSKNYGDWEKAKAEEFKKKYPNVNIQIEVIPFKDIEQKVNVAVAAANPPDILLDNVPLRIIRHGRNGILEPINDVVKDDREDWKEDILKMGSVGDKLYGIPIASLPNIVYLNKTIFEKAGVELPKDRKWTWEQMETALKKVTSKDVYGIGMFAKNEQADHLTISHLMSAGEKWTSEDQSQFTINSPQGVEALQFFLKLQEEGLVAPGAAQMQLPDNDELFKQGKLAILNSLPVVYSQIEAGKKDGSVQTSVEPYGILQVTKSGTSPRVFPTGENGYAVFKQSDADKRKMALEFVKHLLQPDNVKALAKSVQGIPSRKSTSYDITNKDYSELLKEINKLEVVDLGKSQPFYGQVRQKFYPAMQSAWLKSKDPRSILDGFVKEANELAVKSKK
ncbi:MAG: extracellular solute-binding protein [Paenibacillus sp.]|jgi:ABC-type glycerol-3-phosphate transport system substrate-binding protein|nr:extracellular solute-binding protein [Paenibacillus sp.]